MNQPFIPNLAQARPSREDTMTVIPMRSLRGNEPKDTAVAQAEVRCVIMARRMREAMLGDELFADPAWDILLELYAATLEQRRVSTSELCVRSAAPATTALRWIEKLASAGLLTRTNDSLDGRRVWVDLSGEAESKMESYFLAIGGIRRAI
jgi:DNA-binding MarR family transcriptional regulator